MAKKNPLNLNPLQLKTLTLLQELARHPEHASPVEAGGGAAEGGVRVSNLPSPHGDHFHMGEYVVAARDATGLANEAVFVALERKGLIHSGFPLGALLTKAGLAYDTGLREAILHGHGGHGH
jgi:hypothetical protein